MGGHGGLNILPQKRWNVYNWENRERVRKDEEEAARQQQAQEQQDRERDSKARLDKLRGNRGHEHGGDGDGDGADGADGDGDGDVEESLASHEQLLNLFKEDVQRSNKRRRLEPMKAAKKDDRRVVGVEDEKYRLAYGTTSSSRPWYMNMKMNEEEEVEEKARGKNVKSRGSKPKKKSIEELRAERMKREEGERSKARKLMRGVSSTSSKHYNSSYGNARP